jgi:hypothetical protein
MYFSALSLPRIRLRLSSQATEWLAVTQTFVSHLQPVVHPFLIFQMALLNQSNGHVHAQKPPTPSTRLILTVCTVLVFKILETRVLVLASQTRTAMVMLLPFAPISISHHAIIPRKDLMPTRRTCNSQPTATAPRVGSTHLISSTRSTGTPHCSQMSGLPTKELNPSCFPTAILPAIVCTLTL